MDDEFRKRLLSTFIAEAKEHLQAMTKGLLDLERADPEGGASILEGIFREAHSLKGAARAVDMKDVEEVSKSFEVVFSAFREGDLSPTPDIFDLLHKAIGRTDHLLITSQTETPPDISDILEQVSALTVGPEAPLSGIKSPYEITPESDQKASGDDDTSAFEGEGDLPETKKAISVDSSSKSGKPLGDTVRISSDKLDSLMRSMEELLSVRLMLSEKISEMRVLYLSIQEWKKCWMNVVNLIRDRVPPAKNAGETGMEEDIEKNSASLLTIEHTLLSITSDSRKSYHYVSALLDEIFDGIKDVMLLPCSTIFDILPIMVRDISRERGKDVELQVRGGEIEIDKRILEGMKDPLIHLVRNSIDHGIEDPRKRRELNKSAKGKVEIEVSRVGNGMVEFMVRDDGAGMEIGIIKDVAIRKGIITREKYNEFGEGDIPAVITCSGFSTSPIITDISGRGLGLAIVREKVERLGGSITIWSKQDIGAEFHLRLPLSLSTFRGVMVRVGTSSFILPTMNTESVLRVEQGQVKRVENRETITINGSPVSLIHLSALLGIRGKKPVDSGRYRQVVIVRSGLDSVAFVVDAVIGEEEVLVKGLGQQLKKVRHVSGATILGSGEVVPVLDPSDMINSVRRGDFSLVSGHDNKGDDVSRTCNILVVEDSVTARTLLKNILETAGYHVKTAVDGLDAMTALRTEEFDVVVSDVDMPRMNGFALTAKIRNDRKMADMPIVLVTALESREDRERGIDVGANAYIVKSSFEQSNLLDAIRRVI